MMGLWRVKEYLILSKTVEAETRKGAIENFTQAEGDYTHLKMTAKKLKGNKQ